MADPGLLIQAAAIDRAGSGLISQAGGENGRRLRVTQNAAELAAQSLD